MFKCNFKFNGSMLFCKVHKDIPKHPRNAVCVCVSLWCVSLWCVSQCERERERESKIPVLVYDSTYAVLFVCD